tara:strand:+ start:4270 stop:4452 length:183 start_codon:yes stop_codon:yes gene_type:complete
MNHISLLIQKEELLGQQLRIETMDLVVKMPPLIRRFQTKYGVYTVEGKLGLLRLTLEIKL